MSKVIIYNISKGPAQYNGYSAFANLITDSSYNEMFVYGHKLNSTFTKFSCIGLTSALERLITEYNTIDSVTIYTNSTKLYRLFHNEETIIEECTKITDKTTSKYINKVLIALINLTNKFNCKFYFYFLDRNTMDSTNIQKCNKLCNDEFNLCSTEYAIIHMK